MSNMEVDDDEVPSYSTNKTEKKRFEVKKWNAVANSPISISGSDIDDNDLLEIKPPQPKIRKPGYGHKYSDKRSKHKHSSGKYDYHSSSSGGNYYKSHTSSSRYDTDRKHHRYGSDKESAHNKDYYSEFSARDNYHKSGKHHHSHHRVHDVKYESKPKEVRYAEEQELALKDEIKKKEEQLRAKLEKRRHHQRNIKKDEQDEVNVKNSNKFIQADRLKEAYQKESEERMRKHAKVNKQVEDDDKDKTPPRAYDTERTLASIVVVSDESESESDDHEQSSKMNTNDANVISLSPLECNEEIYVTETENTVDEVQNNGDMDEQIEDNDEEEDSSDVSDEDDDDDEDNDDSSNKDSSSSSEVEDDDNATSSSSQSSSSESYSSTDNKHADNLSYREKHKSHSGDDDMRYRRKHSVEKDDTLKKLSSVKNGPSNETDQIPTDDNQISEQQLSEVKVIIKKYFPALQGCRSVEQFHCLNKIEEGTYGIVYRARDKRTNQIVALKRLKMEKEKEGFPITSLREINTLLKAQHPNIVTVREIVVGSNMDKIFIVMDYVEHDLKSLMETMKQRKCSFLPSEVKCLMTQLLMAVDHLHDNWILHRDLKTSNLLFSHQGILKVGDFGLAREYGSPLKHYTSVVVTLWYRAPELLLGTKLYSTPIDMWSIGCIFAELILMEPLLTGKSDADQVNRIFKLLGTPTEQQWPDFRKLPVVQKIIFANYPNNVLRSKVTPNKLSDLGYDLLMKFLTYDPKERISAETALKHDYFKEHPIAIDPAMFPTWPAKSEPGYSKIKAESPKAPSGGQGYKDLGEDEGFFIGERNRNQNYNSTFCLKF